MAKTEVKITCYVPKETAQLIKLLANDMARSTSWLIRESIFSMLLAYEKTKAVPVRCAAKSKIQPKVAKPSPKKPVARKAKPA